MFGAILEFFVGFFAPMGSSDGKTRIGPAVSYAILLVVGVLFAYEIYHLFK
jgi:hypothetical protein